MKQILGALLALTLGASAAAQEEDLPRYDLECRATHEISL